MNPLTEDHRTAFSREGYVLVEGLFSQKEVDLLISQLEGSQRIAGNTWSRLDTEGNESKISLWTNVTEDAFGLVSTNPRIVRNAEFLLGEPVYHWHSKVMLKEPRQGGAWEWHQDYGYWYMDGVPFPRMISCMMSLDASNRENGCLKVLPGSHLLGRIDHVKRGQQSGADPDRVEALQKLFQVHYVETRPGAVLFFHCNLLHASEPNRSEFPRRAYICCYNALSNAPVIGKGHGEPVPIRLSEDAALLSL